jgi:acetyl esterase/lipase
MPIAALLLALLAFPLSHAATAGSLDAALGPMDFCSQTPGSPISGGSEVEYGTATNADGSTVHLKLDVYRPAGSAATTRFPAVMLVHGGAWRKGDKYYMCGPRQVARKLTARGYVVFNVDYRLACDPDDADIAVQWQPYCALNNDVPGSFSPLYPINDLRKALRWIRAHGDESPYYASVAKVGVLGGSAGGHLVQVLGTTGIVGDTKPDAVASWAGGAIALPGYYSGCPVAVPTADTPADCQRVAQVIPLLNVSADDAPTFLARGALDSKSALTFQETLEAALLASRVPVLDHEYPTDIHGEGLLDCAIDDTDAFFSEHLSGAVPGPVVKVQQYATSTYECGRQRTQPKLGDTLPPL